MDVIELRTDLHNMIDKITDSNVLKAVKTLLSEKITGHADWWDTLSDEERSEIEQGIIEADRGEIITHQQAMDKYKNGCKNLLVQKGGKRLWPYCKIPGV